MEPLRKSPKRANCLTISERRDSRSGKASGMAKASFILAWYIRADRCHKKKKLAERQLSCRAPERLVWIVNGEWSIMQVDNYRDLQARNKSFTDLAGFALQERFKPQSACRWVRDLGCLKTVVRSDRTDTASEVRLRVPGPISERPTSRSLSVNATASLRKYPFRSSGNDKPVALSCKLLRNRRSRKKKVEQR